MTIEYYNKNADKFFNDTHNLDMKEIYNEFIKHLPNKGKILDAGCGSGRDTKAFSDFGYKVTAFDASSELVNLARAYTKQNIFHLTFDKITWKNEFDGIWACASLLHVSEKEFQSSGTIIYNALKKNCPFYVSFKYGYKNYLKDNRFFQCHDEDSLYKSMKSIGSFSKNHTWITTDVRPNRKEDKWLNAIYIKS